MANETTKTTLTELVEGELIAPLILDYAYDYTPSAPFMRFQDLRNVPTSVASFPQWVQDAGEDATEASELTNVALETTQNSATAAEVGLLRVITDDALEDTIIGEQIFDFLVEDAGRLLGIMLEDDICALYPSLSNSVGTSAANLTLANMVEAQAKIRTQKMRGPVVYVLDDQQASDYQAALVAATSTTVNKFFDGGAQANSAFLGSFMGAEVWTTGLTDTSGTSDVVGACFIRGDQAPSNACFGMAMSRNVRTELERNASLRATEFVATAKWGVAEIADAAGVKIVTDA